MRPPSLHGVAADGCLGFARKGGILHGALVTASSAPKGIHPDQARERAPAERRKPRGG
jgi:hypothetical protein